MVWRGHRDHINVVPGYELAKVLVSGAILVAVEGVDPFTSVLTGIAIHIVHRQHLAALITQEAFQVAAALAAQADGACK